MTIKKFQKYKKVTIIWRDVTLFPGDYTLEEVDAAITQEVETTGYLIKEDKNEVWVALSLERTEPFRIVDFLKIPKLIVSSIKEIK